MLQIVVDSSFNGSGNNERVHRHVEHKLGKACIVSPSPHPRARLTRAACHAIISFHMISRNSQSIVKVKIFHKNSSIRGCRLKLKWNGRTVFEILKIFQGKVCQELGQFYAKQLLIKALHILSILKKC